MKYLTFGTSNNTQNTTKIKMDKNEKTNALIYLGFVGI